MVYKALGVEVMRMSVFYVQFAPISQKRLVPTGHKSTTRTMAGGSSHEESGKERLLTCWQGC